MKKPIFLLILSVGVASAATVTVPYTQNFTSGAGDFTSDGTTWTSADGVYTNSITAATTSTSSSVDAPSLAGQSFQVSTTFSISTLTGSTSTIGFGVLGDTSSFVTGSATNRFILADVSTDGSMRILGLKETSNLNIVAATNPGNSALAINTLYTLSLSGVYQANGSMNLTLTLSSGSTSNSVSGSISSANLALFDGTNFGYRNRTNSSTALTVNFDDFNLNAIPEPSSAALALLGLPLALMRRRK